MPLKSIVSHIDIETKSLKLYSTAGPHIIISSSSSSNSSNSSSSSFWKTKIFNYGGIRNGNKKNVGWYWRILSIG